MSSKYGMLKITNDKKESINSDDQQFHQYQQNFVLLILVVLLFIYV
jgi:hypothetical protein